MPPDFLDVELHAAAKIDWRILLAHAEAVVVLICLVGRAVIFHIVQAPFNDNQVFVDLRWRSPVPVVLVAGIGGRQSITRTEEVNCSSLPVVTCPDSGF